MSLWTRLRSSFPVTETGVYLDHARVAPISSRVDEAVRAFVDRATRHPGDGEADAIARVRGRVAALLGARADEVAFVPDAARGFEQVVLDVAWRAGDRVALCGDGIGCAASGFADRGIDAIRIPLDRGAFALDRIESALRHPRLRMLALASVEPATGARAPLSAIGELCAARGVLLAVDASHHAGSVELRLRDDRTDYLVADAHRFLMGLSGVGVLLRRGGAAAVRDRPAAADFERGAPNGAGIVALGAAVDLLLELGPAGVEKRVLELTDRLVAGLAECGVDPAVSRTAARSAIVRFRLDAEAPARTAERLAARRIAVSAGADGVRVSPHAYNLPEEIDALLDAL